MKVWEVKLKEKNTPAKNHYVAPVIDTEQIVAKSCQEAAKKGATLNPDYIVTSVILIAETRGELIEKG